MALRWNARRTTFVTPCSGQRTETRLNLEHLCKYVEQEFKLHTHPMSCSTHAARRCGEPERSYSVGHTPYHKTANMKKFIREHPMLKVKVLPEEEEPNLSLLESRMSMPFKSAVCMCQQPFALRYRRRRTGTGVDFQGSNVQS